MKIIHATHKTTAREQNVVLALLNSLGLSTMEEIQSSGVLTPQELTKLKMAWFVHSQIAEWFDAESRRR